MPDSALESADDLLRSVEACLFAAEEPLTREQISAHLGDADVKEALASLREQYSKRGINLVERGKRWQFQTAPDLAAREGPSAAPFARGNGSSGHYRLS
jgi:segregation and condensation protein B